MLLQLGRALPQPRHLAAQGSDLGDRVVPDPGLELVVKQAINDPPRAFQVGRTEKIWIRDCAHISLEPDEQVTFLTGEGAEYDVARKDWGFYATPSLNSRLARFGLRGVLVRN